MCTYIHDIHDMNVDLEVQSTGQQVRYQCTMYGTHTHTCNTTLETNIVPVVVAA